MDLIDIKIVIIKTMKIVWRALPPALQRLCCGYFVPDLTRFTNVKCEETRHMNNNMASQYQTYPDSTKFKLKRNKQREMTVCSDLKNRTESLSIQCLEKPYFRASAAYLTALLCRNT